MGMNDVFGSSSGVVRYDLNDKNEIVAIVRRKSRCSEFGADGVARDFNAPADEQFFTMTHTSSSRQALANMVRVQRGEGLPVKRMLMIPLAIPYYVERNFFTLDPAGTVTPLWLQRDMDTDEMVFTPMSSALFKWLRGQKFTGIAGGDPEDVILDKNRLAEGAIIETGGVKTIPTRMVEA